MYKYTCQKCSNEFDHKDKGKKYCSQKCCKDASKKGEIKNCIQCGKECYIVLPKLKIHKKNQFCSWDCHMEWQRQRRPVRICLHCKQEFKKKARVNAMFCSTECKLSSDHNILQLANMRKKQAQKMNNLEVEAYALMDRIGLVYERQFVFARRFVADAYVPSSNTIVQFDGDFWHAHPDYYPEPKYPHQIACVERDRRSDAQAKQLGFNVLRFWESDLKQNPDMVQSKLQSLKPSN